MSHAPLCSVSVVAFDAVPPELARQAFGVRFVQWDDPSGGRLWVTEHGWRHLPLLDPANWFVDRQYERRGVRLTEGSGAVYRVPVNGEGRGPNLDLVVKFSRMAQEVRLHVSSEFQAAVAWQAEAEAEFPSPFREFAAVEKLRRQMTNGLRILTKRPLAIYSPAARFEPRQLGRTNDRFQRLRRELDRDQAAQRDELPQIELLPDRHYVSLFHWVRGADAEQLVRQGLLTPQQASEIVEQAVRDLDASGFRMLDIKPSHIILRRRRDGELLRRGARLVYALVDFELLQVHRTG